MLTSYSNADLIRSMEPDVFAVDDTTNFPDATLRLWARDYADPEIDARLGTGFGVPFPVSTYTDLASTQASSWLTVTTAAGTFDTTSDVDLVLVIPADDGNFNADEYRISAVGSTTSLTITEACGDTGNATAGDGWIANAPALIRRISAMLAAAYGLDSSVAKAVTRTVGRADDLRNRAFSMLDDLKKGKLSISGYPTGTYSGAVAVGQDPETRPDTQVFVDDAPSWTDVTELREG